MMKIGMAISAVMLACVTGCAGETSDEGIENPSDSEQTAQDTKDKQAAPDTKEETKTAKPSRYPFVPDPCPKYNKCD